MFENETWIQIKVNCISHKVRQKHTVLVKVSMVRCLVWEDDNAFGDRRALTLGLGGLTLSFTRGGVFRVSLRGVVEVFDLAKAGKLIFIVRKNAEEDPAAQHQDGGPPAEAVRPRVVVIAFIDQLVELDGVDDQSDYLHDYCSERKQSHFTAHQNRYSDPKRVWTLQSHHLINHLFKRQSVSTLLGFSWLDNRLAVQNSQRGKGAVSTPLAHLCEPDFVYIWQHVECSVWF